MIFLMLKTHAFQFSSLKILHALKTIFKFPVGSWILLLYVYDCKQVPFKEGSMKGKDQTLAIGFASMQDAGPHNYAGKWGSHRPEEETGGIRQW